MIISLSQLTIVTAIGTTWEIRTGATPGRARLLELGIFNNAATAGVIGLGRPGAIGAGATGLVDFQPEDPNDVLASGVVQGATGWTTAPTAPTAFFRVIALPATIAVGVIWTFPKGIVIPVSSSIVLYLIAASSALRAYAVLDV